MTPESVFLAAIIGTMIGIIGSVIIIGILIFSAIGVHDFIGRYKQAGRKNYGFEHTGRQRFVTAWRLFICYDINLCEWKDHWERKQR